MKAPNKICIYGKGGCLAEDTFLAYQIRTQEGKTQNSKGGTIAHLYDRFHNIPRNGQGYYQRGITLHSDFYIQSVTDEDKIFMNKIVDVIYSGQKTVFKIITSSGNSLEATEDHKFRTPLGYISLKDLQVNDIVYIRPSKTKSLKDKKERIHRPEIMVKYHPKAVVKVVNGYTYYRVRRARFVYEAFMNEVNFNTYRYMLNNWDKESINNLWTIPEGMSIHHLDENPINDVIENLVLLPEQQHQSIHRRVDDKDSCRNNLVEETYITSIEEVGIKPTYDIVCAEPYRNFIANNIAVHNSGKSHCTATLFKILSPGSQVVYLMTERNAAAGLRQGLKHNKLEMEDGDLTFFYPKKREKSFTNLKASLEKFQDQSLAEALKGDAQKTDNKNRYGYFIEIASSLTAFKGEDYATGNEVKLGNVGDLTESDWLIIDGLSVISNEIKKTCLGDKYIAISRNDYQRPQAVLVDFMQDLQSIPCNVILLAHEETIYEKVVNPRTKEEESVEKGAQVALNMGAKIQSTVMGCFSEVIYASSVNGRFSWDTSNSTNYGRTTKLPAKTGLEPDFSKYPVLFEDL